MTRVVVIGPYPPTGDPRAEVVLACVRELRAAGAAVEVVSPEPSAAPHHGDPTTWVGATRVARALEGADRVVWFAASAHGPTPAPLRRALAAVPRVERRSDPGSSAHRARPARRARPAWTTQLARLRAGGPTFVRTVADRARRRTP